MTATLAAIEVWLLDPFGVRMFLLSNYNRLEYGRVINDIGILEIVVPGSDVVKYLKRDCQIEIWRQLQSADGGGGRPILDMETTWFVRKYETSMAASGAISTKITAHSTTELIKRRLIAYPKASSQADKTMAADDMLKQYATENFGASAGSVQGRNLSAYVRIQGNTTQAPSITKKAAWKELLPTMQEICAASEAQLVPLFFDIVPTGDISGGPLWEFRTYTGSRGVDRSSTGIAPLLFEPESGNITIPSYLIDWTEERNFVYGLGKGHEAQRQEVTSQDTARLSASPYGLYEKVHDCRNYNTAAEMQQESDAALREARPREMFSCELVSTLTTMYGRDWGFGDLITVAFAGKKFDCRIDAIKITIAPGMESITTKLKNGVAV